MTTFAEAVRYYEKRCTECDVPPETVMAYLVELSQRERYDLYAEYDSEMPEELQTEFAAGMERILKQEPMAHVLGYSWFYGYKMVVNGDVLIPRYETEELCANVLADIDLYFPGDETLSCADVGTGSGAIAVTLVREEPRVRMTATDISEEALVTARENARINVIDNAEFMVGKAEEVLPEFYESHSDNSDNRSISDSEDLNDVSHDSGNATTPDVIVVDPPRKGCDEACLETMLKMQPARIVYVSCDPATLARDLKYLCASGDYELKKASCTDMFSNSVHVECVSLLQRMSNTRERTITLDA